MKKLFTILLICLSIGVQAQNMKNLILDYELHQVTAVSILFQTYRIYVDDCNQLVDYETTQYGSIQMIPHPIDSLGKLKRYEWRQAKDTLWANPYSPEHRDDFDEPNFSSGTIMWNSSGTLELSTGRIEYREVHEPINVSRAVTVQIKKEKPSMEGLWMWIQRSAK